MLAAALRSHVKLSRPRNVIDLHPSLPGQVVRSGEVSSEPGARRASRRATFKIIPAPMVRQHAGLCLNIHETRYVLWSLKTDCTDLRTAARVQAGGSIVDDAGSVAIALSRHGAVHRTVRVTT